MANLAAPTMRPGPILTDTDLAGVGYDGMPRGFRGVGASYDWGTGEVTPTGGSEVAKAKNFVEKRKEAPTSLFGLGANYGMDVNATAQFMSQILQLAGGNFKQINAGNLQLAAGLDRRYGVGGDVFGAFMRGGRTGATMGADGEKAIIDAMKQGVSLGLEGSDLSNYMRETASTLMQFDQTGIPLDIAQLAQAVATSGFGTMRGGTIARGFREVGAQIGSSGPQNAMQFLIFRKLFGYQGGGVDDYVNAAENASTGTFVEGGFQNLLGSLSQSKNPRVNGLVIQQAFSQAGIQIGLPEAIKVASGDQDAIEQAKKTIAAGTQEALGLSSGGIAAAGVEATPGAARAAAGLANERIGAGERMLPAMQEFERSTTQMLKNASEFSGIVKDIAKVATEISKALGPGATKLADVLESIAIKVGL